MLAQCHLKKRFCCFLAKLRCFQLFCTAWRFLVFLQVITMIVTLSHSKKYFCFFFLAGSHSNETFSRFKSKISMSSTFFALETVFGCSKLITLFYLKSKPQHYFCFCLVISALFSSIAPKTLFFASFLLLCSFYVL